jgi:hypothetical protein
MAAHSVAHMEKGSQDATQMATSVLKMTVFIDETLDM